MVAPPKLMAICQEIELEVLVELDAGQRVIECAHEMVARTRLGLMTPIPDDGCETNRS